MNNLRQLYVACRYGHVDLTVDRKFSLYPLPLFYLPERAAAAKYGFEGQSYEALRGKAIWKKCRKCRYCHEDIEEEQVGFTNTYWQGLLDLSHSECKKEGEREEAYECQSIDADCNDCRHFKREDRQEGRCMKTLWRRIIRKKVKAQPQFCSSLECFDHRRLV